jgi:hypothetical protein
VIQQGSRVLAIARVNMSKRFGSIHRGLRRTSSSFSATREAGSWVETSSRRVVNASPPRRAIRSSLRPG